MTISEIIITTPLSHNNNTLIKKDKKSSIGKSTLTFQNNINMNKPNYTSPEYHHPSQQQQRILFDANPFDVVNLKHLDTANNNLVVSANTNYIGEYHSNNSATTTSSTSPSHTPVLMTPVTIVNYSFPTTPEHDDETLGYHLDFTSKNVAHALNKNGLSDSDETRSSHPKQNHHHRKGGKQQQQHHHQGQQKKKDNRKLSSVSSSRKHSDPSDYQQQHLSQQHRKTSGTSSQVSRYCDMKQQQQNNINNRLQQLSQSEIANLYKTELCRSWEETGTCRYGNKCQFAHSGQELRSVDRHPKYKTEMCKTFWEKGSCPYGKRCCFVHAEKTTDTRALSALATNTALSIATAVSNASSSLNLQSPITTPLSSSPSAVMASGSGDNSGLMSELMTQRSPLQSGVSVENIWKNKNVSAPTTPSNMRISPFVRMEDTIKGPYGLLVDDYLGTSGIEKSLQSLSLGHDQQQQGSCTNVTSMPLNSPFARRSSYEGNNFGDFSAAGRLRTASAASLHHQRSSHFYTPQFQTLHRFRSESIGAPQQDYSFWNEPMFPGTANNNLTTPSHQGHHSGPQHGLTLPTTNGLLSQHHYPSCEEVPVFVQHQRTFSSPALSLMFDSNETVPSTITAWSKINTFPSTPTGHGFRY